MVIDHDVFSFDVSVNDALSVAVGDRLDNLLHYDASFRLTMSLLFSEMLVEDFSLNELHHKVHVSIVVVGLVVVHNIGVV